MTQRLPQSTDEATSGFVNVVDFWGDFDGYEMENRVSDNGREYQMVTFKYKEVEALKTLQTPWIYPTMTITMIVSTRADGEMMMLFKSIEDLTGVKGIDNAIGQRHHLVCDPEHDFGSYRNRKTGEMVENIRPLWQVTEIGGVGSSSGGLSYILGLLDGKTLSEFQQIAFPDKAVQDNKEVMNGLVNGQYPAEWIRDGLVMVDAQGVYHLEPVKVS